MSVAELKRAVDKLPAEGRRELLEHLQQCLDDPACQPDVARELDDLIAGVKVAREQASRREGVAAEDARRLVDSWASR